MYSLPSSWAGFLLIEKFSKMAECDKSDKKWPPLKLQHTRNLVFILYHSTRNTLVLIYLPQTLSNFSLFFPPFWWIFFYFCIFLNFLPIQLYKLFNQSKVAQNFLKACLLLGTHQKFIKNHIFDSIKKENYILKTLSNWRFLIVILCHFNNQFKTFSFHHFQLKSAKVL